jgi:alanyl-tRNA synthetase
MVVVECFDAGGYIWHIVEGERPQFGVGDGIIGQIDFARRFAFMQNHTGEHVLSGLAKRLWGATNRGFHMSQHGFTMDLDIQPDWMQVETLEMLANKAVLEAVDVGILDVAGYELADMDARSKRDFSAKDAVRLVDIAGYDLCACAGMHVRNTHEVRLVRILGAQKYKGGVRLNVCCGNDALLDYKRKDLILKEISRLTSSEILMCAAAVEKLLTVNAGLKKDLGLAKSRIFKLKAAQVPENSGLAWFCEDGLDMDDMRRFAEAVAQRARLAVILSGRRYFICGRDANELRDFVRKFNEELGGKGGVNNLAAQGAVTAELSAIEEFLGDEIHR